MKESWKSFVESLPYDVEFLHRDEFQEQYPEKNDEPLPALFIIEDESIESAISAETINKAHSVTDLITTVSSFLERMNKDKNI